MRLLRSLLLVTASALIAIVVVSDAGATRFADQPCPESGPGGIRVCPGAVVGRSYAIQLLGDGGCGPALPYQYRVLNGALPPGLTLTRDGEIAGVPRDAGNFAFWVELSDQDPPSASWCTPKQSQREFEIRVGVPPATVGSTYTFTLGASGEARTWSLTAGVLPPGLSLDPTSGVVAGTPASVGSFSLTFVGTDTQGRTATTDLTLTVYARLAFVSSRLSPVTAERRFRAALKTTGAVGRARFKVLSGRFPTGVTLDGRAGIVRGKPRKSGVYHFTIEAQDSLGRRATRRFVLIVRRSLH